MIFAVSNQDDDITNDKVREGVCKRKLATEPNRPAILSYERLVMTPSCSLRWSTWLRLASLRQK